MLTLGIVGVGDWGKNYVRTIEEHFPDVTLIQGNRDNWKKLKCDGVIISTPPDSHVEIAKFFLKKNIPTIIEKPLALSVKEARQLSKFKSPILVNHIHLFAPAYEILKGNINSKSDIISIESSGMNNGPFRDWCPLFDYGSHDIAICLDLLKEYPNKINAQQIPQGPGKIFIVNLEFSNCKATIKVGNGALYKYKNTQVNLKSNKYAKLVYEDNKLTGFREEYLNKIYVPNISPLQNAVQIFTDSINGKMDPRLGLDLSLNVLKVLEECKHILC